jgi:SAM-dependent methyltransferase
MSIKKIKLDYGSGYAAKPGYQTADICGRPDYFIDSRTCRIGNLSSASCCEVWLKNVFHHILNTEDLDREMFRLLNKTGRLIVVEPSRENYQSNLFLDRLWYRGVNNRPEIVWSNEYRSPKVAFSSFELLKKEKKEVYEIFIFAPKS